MKPLHGTSQRSRFMRTSCLHPSPFPLVWLTGTFPCCRAGDAACARQEPRLCRASRPPSLTGTPKSQGIQCWPVQECQGGLPCLPSEREAVGKDPSPIPKRMKVLEQISLAPLKGFFLLLAAVGRSSIRKAPHHISPEHLHPCPGTGTGLPQKQVFSPAPI